MLLYVKHLIRTLVTGVKCNNVCKLLQKPCIKVTFILLTSFELEQQSKKNDVHNFKTSANYVAHKRQIQTF